MKPSVRVGVDIGGTFTDFVLDDPGRGLTRTEKRLSTPDAPARGVIEGLGRLLGGAGVALTEVATIVHGTTIVTNTLLERTGARVGLIATEGFRDTLEMGREIRYDVDDLAARPAPVLVPRERRHGVGGRMRADGSEHARLDGAAVRRAASTLVERDEVEAIAVALLHSYANPAHELQAGELIARDFPRVSVTLSAQVAAVRGEFERTNTACVNAYTQPPVRAYLDDLQIRLRAGGFQGVLLVMLSSGGVTTVEEAMAFPVRLLESGPAAGAIAASYLANRVGEDRLISFDMGGTTAKMCVIEEGRPRIRHEFEAARVDKFKRGSGLPLSLTVTDMIEIGAGGGSIAAIDDAGLMRVGPRSAGSVPGPVAYGRGGSEPTVTDADLVLGHLDSRTFLGGEMPLAIDDVVRALDQLGGPLELASPAVAAGIVDIATESMAAATRAHLAEAGRDPRDYTLMAFGGAGPVHAYALATRLKIRKVLVPLGAGVTSAFGLLAAPPAVDYVRSYAGSLVELDWARVRSHYDDMTARTLAILGCTSDSAAQATLTRSADMRYAGQGFELEVPLPEGELEPELCPAIAAAFEERYRLVHGRAVSDVPAEVINWRLHAELPASTITLEYSNGTGTARRGTRVLHFPGVGDVAAVVYDRYALSPGTCIAGPAVFEERETSFGVGPDWRVAVDRHLNLVAEPTSADADQRGDRDGIG